METNRSFSVRLALCRVQSGGLTPNSAFFRTSLLDFELLLQPLQHGALIIAMCFTNVGEELEAVRLGRGDVLKTFVAVAADRAQVARLVVSAFVFLDDVTDR
jgi:hypothetical protein